jgi:uncharacterized protein YgiM (DUF1202 family)
VESIGAIVGAFVADGEKGATMSANFLKSQTARLTAVTGLTVAFLVPMGAANAANSIALAPASVAATVQSDAVSALLLPAGITMTTGKVNVRATPSCKGKITGTIPKGDEVIPLKRSGGWLKVRYIKSGAKLGTMKQLKAAERTGWVSTYYLEGPYLNPAKKPLCK